MSYLPEDCLISGQPPSSSVGVHIFGLWSIITRRTRSNAANSKNGLYSLVSLLGLFTTKLWKKIHPPQKLMRFVGLSPYVDLFKSYDQIEEQILLVLRWNWRSMSLMWKKNTFTTFSMNKKWPGSSTFLTSLTWKECGSTWRILDAILLDYGSRSLTHEVSLHF